MVKKGKGKRELRNLEWEMNDGVSSAGYGDVYKRGVRDKNTVDP